MATTLVLAAHPDGSPAPYVDVLVDSIDVGVSFVTVWRTVGTRAMRVRGLVNVASGGAVTARDFEAGFDVVTSYRAEQFDASGNFISFSDASTVTLSPDPAPSGPLRGCDVAWVHNPLDPSTAVQVFMLAPAAKTLRRPNTAEMFRIPGRSVGVAITSGRRGIEGVALDCYTGTLADAARFDSLFGGYDDDTIPILCFRTPPAMQLPATLFALVSDPQQVPINARWGGEDTAWGLTGDEVAPPAEAIIVALLDYADFTAFYSSIGTEDYAAFTASYADYTAATRDYSIAGAA